MVCFSSWPALNPRCRDSELLGDNVLNLRLSIFMAHCCVSCGYNLKFIEQDRINVSL